MIPISIFLILCGAVFIEGSSDPGLRPPMLYPNEMACSILCGSGNDFNPFLLPVIPTPGGILKSGPGGLGGGWLDNPFLLPARPSSSARYLVPLPSVIKPPRPTFDPTLPLRPSFDWTLPFRP